MKGVQYTATFTHSYSQAGTYTPIFTVTNEKGLSAQTSLSVNVGNAIAPTPIPFISVFSPNGGEMWQVGKTYDIKWSASGVPVVDIILTNNATPGSGEVYIAHGVTVPSGIYSWTVPTSVTPGSYGIRIEGGIYMEGKGARQYLDESNAPFTITTPTPILSCTDTDGGDNPNIKGTAVSTNSNGGVGTSPDVCHKDKGAPDDGYLTEFSCASNGGITPREVYCTYGCNAGACLPAPTITVLSPNGGETLIAGQPFTIKWQAWGITNVGASLWNWSTKTATGYSVACSYTGGLCTWTLPSTVPAGQYFIRVGGADIGTANIHDDSDAAVNVTN